MKKIKNHWLPLTDQGYHCFACAPTNPYGLKMEFYEDGEDIVSLWTPRENYQGWLHTLHGGIQATLLDEIGGWVISRKLQTSAVTSNLNVRYRKPVPTGENLTLELRARIKSQKRNFVEIEATLSHNGELCTSADITYYCFSQQKAREEYYFTSCDLE